MCTFYTAQTPLHKVSKPPKEKKLARKKFNRSEGGSAILPPRTLHSAHRRRPQIRVEERPVRAVERRPSSHRRLRATGTRIDGPYHISPLLVSLGGLDVCAPLLQRHGGDVERDIDGRVLVLAREPEAVGNESALRPPIGDVGEVPFHDFRFGVPRKLVPGVDKGLYRGGVDEVD